MNIDTHPAAAFLTHLTRNSIAMHPRLAHGSDGRSIIYSLPEIRTEERS